MYLQVRVGKNDTTFEGLIGNIGACKCYEKYNFKIMRDIECQNREDGQNCYMYRLANGGQHSSTAVSSCKYAIDSYAQHIDSLSKSKFGNATLAHRN